jgi:hypothetical protein
VKTRAEYLALLASFEAALEKETDPIHRVWLRESIRVIKRKTPQG